ncbi:hypothetical protein FQR65_LT07875 [Abscondita terminalis]|nr:hypothetical protein FQR65_LT07875 [Abscondita terminalis]
MYNKMLIILFLGISIQAEDSNLTENISKYVKECISNSSMDEETLADILKQHVTPENNNEFMKVTDCFLQKSEIVTNDEFDLNKLRLLLPHMVQFSQKVDAKTAELLVKQIPEECYHIEKIEPAVAYSIKVRNCAIKHIHSAIRADEV